MIKKTLFKWRKRWEIIQNEALERFGSLERVSCLSLKAQGIDRIPTIHEGPAASRIESRGEHSYRVAENNEIKRLNSEYAEAIEQKKSLAYERSALEKEIAVVEKDIAAIESAIRGILLEQEQEALRNQGIKNVVYGKGFNSSSISKNKYEHIIKLAYRFLKEEERKVDNEILGIIVRKSDVEQEAITEFYFSNIPEKHILSEAKQELKASEEAFKEAFSTYMNKINMFEKYRDYNIILQLANKPEPKREKFMGFTTNSNEINRWKADKDIADSIIDTMKPHRDRLDNAKEALAKSQRAYDARAATEIPLIINKHINARIADKRRFLMNKKLPFTNTLNNLVSKFSDIDYSVGMTEKDESLAISMLVSIFSMEPSQSQKVLELKETTDILMSIFTKPDIFNKFQEAVELAFLEHQSQNHTSVAHSYKLQ